MTENYTDFSNQIVKVCMFNLSARFLELWTDANLLAYSLIPAIKNFTQRKKTSGCSWTSHGILFNTHPYVAPIIGVTSPLKKRATKLVIDDAVIRKGLKLHDGLLAGIGRSSLRFTVRPILGALGASLSRLISLVHLSLSHGMHHGLCGTPKNLIQSRFWNYQRYVWWDLQRHHQRGLLSLGCSFLSPS